MGGTQAPSLVARTLAFTRAGLALALFAGTAVATAQEPPWSAENLAVAWDLPHGSVVDVVVPGRVVVITVWLSATTSATRALDIATGRTVAELGPILAREHAPAFTPSNAVTCAGLAIVSQELTAEGSVAVVALDPTTGAVAWRHTVVASRAYLGVTAAGPLLLVQPRPLGSETATVLPVEALDCATGRTRWTSSALPPRDGRVPARAAGVLVIAAGTSVVAVDEATGAVRWRAPIAATDVDAEGDTIVALAHDIVVLNPGDGRVRARWPAPAGSQTRDIEVRAGIAIIAGEGGVFGVRLATGAVAWSVASTQASLVETGGGEPLAELSGEYRVLNAATGRTLFTWRETSVDVLPGAPGGYGLAFLEHVLLRAPRAAPAFHATVAGTARLDRQPVAGVRVTVHGTTVVTDADGAYQVPVDAPGEQSAHADVASVHPTRVRPCVDEDYRSCVVVAPGATVRCDFDLTSHARQSCGECDCTPDVHQHP